MPEQKNYHLETSPETGEFAKLEQRYKELVGDEDFGIDFYERCFNLAEKIKLRYPDFTSRRFYHLLAGSTIKEGSPVNDDDFPGEDSIADFINHEYEEFLKLRKTE